MNYGRAFSYVMEDPKWLQKIGIAALILIVPILGQIVVLGWVLEVTRHVINGEPDVLPDWSNFGDFLAKGFQAFVVAIVYALPVILLQGCFQGLNAALVSMSANGGDQAQTFQSIANVLGIVGICVSCVVFIYDLAIGVILPAALGNFAATGQIAGGFRFNEILGLVRSAPGPYIIVLLLSFVTSLISILGLIACIIGVLVTAAYSATVNAHLWGQAYKMAKSLQAGMPPAAPVETAAPSM